MRTGSRDSCAGIHFLACTAEGQVVTGTLKSQSGGGPVAGVLVTLVRPAGGKLMDRALSNGTGQYRVRANEPGNYQISVKRIGVRPRNIRVDSLNAGEERRVDVSVEAIATALEAVRVAVPNRCGREAEQGGITARLLEEAQTVLRATQVVISE